MGDDATACAAGLGIGAGIGAGCAALLFIPPLAAGCFAVVGIPGIAVAVENSVEACQNAANGRRKKRSNGYYGNRNPFYSPREFTGFDVFDFNKDGYISEADMPTAVSDPYLKMMMISIMTVLPMMDVSKDGRLSKDEVMAFGGSLQTDQQQLQMIYKFLDINQDKKLSPSEMIQSLGTCSLMGQRTDAWDGYKQTMDVLGCEQKGYVEFQDVWNWYKNQPKPAKGTLLDFDAKFPKATKGVGVSVKPALTPWQTENKWKYQGHKG